jgi:hypothetical protein
LESKYYRIREQGRGAGDLGSRKDMCLYSGKIKVNKTKKIFV